MNKERLAKAAVMALLLAANVPIQGQTYEEGAKVVFLAGGCAVADSSSTSAYRGDTNKNRPSNYDSQGSSSTYNQGGTSSSNYNQSNKDSNSYNSANRNNGGYVSEANTPYDSSGSYGNQGNMNSGSNYNAGSSNYNRPGNYGNQGNMNSSGYSSSGSYQGYSNDNFSGADPSSKY